MLVKVLLTHIVTFHITDKLINTYIKTDVVFVFERDNILELPQV